MLNPELIKQRVEQLLNESPLAGLSNDLKTVLQAQLQGMISSMNLVTREEFDAQLSVLERTQDQLKAMEQRLDALAKQYEDIDQ